MINLLPSLASSSDALIAGLGIGAFIGFLITSIAFILELKKERKNG